MKIIVELYEKSIENFISKFDFEITEEEYKKRFVYICNEGNIIKWVVGDLLGTDIEEIIDKLKTWDFVEN